MMEVFSVDKLFFGRTRTAYEHALKLRMLKKLIVGGLADAFEELVDSYKTQPFETSLTLAAFRMLAGHSGCEVLYRFNVFAVKDADRRLVSVHNDQSEHILLFKHVLERLKVCLLYTSDAADDLLRVDLGGR